MYEVGFPKERGLYRCKVGENNLDQVLVHHYCGENKKHWWTDTAGYDVLEKVMYNPEPLAVRKKR